MCVHMFFTPNIYIYIHIYIFNTEICVCLQIKHRCVESLAKFGADTSCPEWLPMLQGINDPVWRAEKDQGFTEQQRF